MPRPTRGSSQRRSAAGPSAGAPRCQVRKASDQDRRTSPAVSASPRRRYSLLVVDHGPVVDDDHREHQAQVGDQRVVAPDRIRRVVAPEQDLLRASMPSSRKNARMMNTRCVRPVPSTTSSMAVHHRFIRRDRFWQTSAGSAARRRRTSRQGDDGGAADDVQQREVGQARLRSPRCWPAQSPSPGQR
jgi:hypothetical protein